MTTVPHVSATANRDFTGVASLAGIVAGPLFLGLILLNTWLSLDFLHSIGWELFGGESLPYPSCLALGQHGWMQTTAFFVTGVLVITFATGLRVGMPRRRSSTIAVVLLALFGTAIAASSARADWGMVDGHDPSTPNGWVHGLAFVVAVPSILAATVVVGIALRGDGRWRPLAIVSPLVGAALVVSLIFGPHGQASFLIFLTILFGWILALALRLRRIDALAAG